MTTHILFLCPHSAGKSVLAATYFRSAAARLDVDATAAVAGTDPDVRVMPNIKKALEQQGFKVKDSPHAVTAAETERADIVVSIGCDHGDIPTDTIVEWDVPMLSDDFEGSMNAIYAHAEQLAHSLKGKSPDN